MISECGLCIVWNTVILLQHSKQHGHWANTPKNFGLFQPVYRVAWVAHIMYVGVLLKENLFKKLYVINLLWYEILQSKDKLSDLFKKSSYAKFDVTLHSNEQICNVTSQILEQITQFVYVVCHIKQANFLPFCWTNYSICLCGMSHKAGTFCWTNCLFIWNVI